MTDLRRRNLRRTGFEGNMEQAAYDPAKCIELLTGAKP